MFFTLVILAASCVTLAGLINPALANPSQAIRVKAGQSIQAAIASAHPGDKIVVEAGTYAEQLTISLDGISLVGRNAILVPPSSPVSNTCSDLAGAGTQAGICVTGSDVALQDLKDFDGEHRKVLSVGKSVRDSSVSGFTVQGFSGINIAIVGAINAVVSQNSVSSSAQYGILTVGSQNSQIKQNVVLSTPGAFPFYFIGICMDDVSTVTIARNDVSGYFIGLCVQTDGADIHDNTVHDTCIGANVDPGVKGAILHDNQFRDTLPGCPVQASLGVLLSGAVGTIVRKNSFSGFQNSGQAAAVAVVDDPKGAIASDNVVRRNTFTSNDLDIFEKTTGTGNVFKNNQCTSSVPANICQAASLNSDNTTGDDNDA